MTTNPTTPPEPTPTEPVNPLPTQPSDLPAPPVPVEPTPTSTGDDGGTTNAQPHCTPEQIADGKCDRG